MVVLGYLILTVILIDPGDHSWSVSGSMYWKSILRYPKLTIPQLKSEFSQTHMSMDSSLELPDFHASCCSWTCIHCSYGVHISIFAPTTTHWRDTSFLRRCLEFRRKSKMILYPPNPQAWLEVVGCSSE